MGLPKKQQTSGISEEKRKAFETIDKGKKIMQNFETNLISVKGNENITYKWAQNLSREELESAFMFLINECADFNNPNFYDNL